MPLIREESKLCLGLTNVVVAAETVLGDAAQVARAVAAVAAAAHAAAAAVANVAAAARNRLI